MKRNFKATKVRLDGSNLLHNSLIRQLSEYRKALRMECKHIVQSYPSIKSISHCNGLEKMRQRENSLQVQEYAAAIGIQQITLYTTITHEAIDSQDNKELISG